MTGLYELKGKLKYWKDKYNKDIQQLQKEITQYIGKIDELYKEINTIKKNSYFYRLWFKERQERIKLARENHKLEEKLKII